MAEQDKHVTSKTRKHGEETISPTDNVSSENIGCRPSLGKARTSARAVHVGFASLGLPATARCRVRDLWARKELGVFAAGFGVAVAGHGARMLSVNVVHDPDSARAHGGRALSTQ